MKALPIIYKLTMSQEERREVFGSRQNRLANELNEAIKQHFLDKDEFPTAMPQYYPCLTVIDGRVKTVLYSCLKFFPVFYGDPEYAGQDVQQLPILDDDGFAIHSEELLTDNKITNIFKDFKAPNWEYGINID